MDKHFLTNFTFIFTLFSGDKLDVCSKTVILGMNNNFMTWSIWFTCKDFITKWRLKRFHFRMNSHVSFVFTLISESFLTFSTKIRFNLTMNNLTCLNKLPSWVNIFSQTSQSYSLSLVGTDLMFVVRLLFLVKQLPQISHLWALTPVWVSQWRLKIIL